MEEIKKQEITIIIPTYKPKEYLQECIASLLNQTLDVEKYKILVVLNDEKEPYYSKLEELYKYKTNIKILYTEKKGVSNARNLGILKTETDYLIFVDDDDFVSKHFLKGLYEKRILNGIVCSNTLVFDENKKISRDYLGKHFKDKKKNIKRKNLFYHRKQFSNSCGKLIPKQIIKNKFNISFNKGEDSLFMAELASNVLQVKYSFNKGIYYRRIRKNSASRKYEEKKEVLNRKIKLIGHYIRLLTKKNKSFILSRIVAQIKK